MGDARTRVYRKGELEAEGFPVTDVSEHLERDDTVVWVDFCAPDEQALHELAEELGLHELAVEDALGEHQRPKLDRYDTHEFLSCHAVRLDVAGERLDETEIDAFINPRWLITVRKNEGFPIDRVVSRWDSSKRLASFGVPFLVYGLLDMVVDGYFETVSAFDDYYDKVSETIFAGERPLPVDDQREWFAMRRALVHFHRFVVPMREAISSLMRRESGEVPQEMYPYFQDVYDHILRVSESTESLRDLVTSIVETNLGLRDYQQNVIMKKVTSWAAIIAVPTLITGYYGMNVPYPGEGRPWGVVLSSVLVVILAVVLYLQFRKRDWL